MRMSIIIPVHNSAATLDRCLESILAQTFGDYQVVIVDDGSADESLALAAEYARRDGRFTVVSEPCQGPGTARNTGLSLARGEYVLYMDADDYWMRADLLQQLEDRIRRQPADVYMYQMAKVKEDGTILRRYAIPDFTNADTVLDLDAVYEDLVRDGHTLAAAWNKCVRRELLLEKGIRFREDIIGEDIDWVLQLFSHVRSICLLNLQAYAYTQHRGVSRSRRHDGPNDLVKIVREWSAYAERPDAAHSGAVAGLVAFQYGICMGYYHCLSARSRRILREDVGLLERGLDSKTRMISAFYGIFGFRLTCLAIRTYLFLRRIW